MEGNRTSQRKISTLARAKQTPVGFIDEPRSVYWFSKCSKDWNDKDKYKNTEFCGTDKLVGLTHPKPHCKDWIGERPSAMWPVSKNALRAKATARLCSLAVSKQHHPDYLPPKSLPTRVSTAAKTTLPSIRLKALSKPKKHAEIPVKPDSWWEGPLQWHSDVSKGALKHIATERVLQLANPKRLYKHYNEGRPAIWAVSSAAKKAEPTPRLYELSKPKRKNDLKKFI